MTVSTTELSRIFEGDMPVYVVGIDIKGYSTHDDSATVVLQKSLDNLLADSIAKLIKDKKIYDNYWIDGGDGGFLLINCKSADVPIYVLKALEAQIRERNEGSKSELQFTLRYALHFGEIKGWPGRLGQRFAARILDSMDRTLEGQVVVSEDFKRVYTKFLGANNIRYFSELDSVVDKHGNEHKIWNFFLGHDLGVEVLDGKGDTVNP